MAGGDRPVTGKRSRCPGAIRSEPGDLWRPGRNRGRLSGSGSTGRSHLAVTPCPRSGHRSGGSPRRAHGHVRKARFLLPGSFVRGGPPEGPGLSPTSLRCRCGAFVPNSALEWRSLHESSSGRRPISILAFRERRSEVDPVRAMAPYQGDTSRPVPPPSHDALLTERVREESSRPTVGFFGQRPPGVGHTPVASRRSAPVMGSGRSDGPVKGSSVRGPVHESGITATCLVPLHVPVAGCSAHSGDRQGGSRTRSPLKGVSRDRIVPPRET